MANKKGNKSQFILPDGTKVWLNADKSLSYKPFDGETSHTILLVPGKDTTMVILPTNINVVIEYTTIIKPHEAAMDTFYTISNSKFNHRAVPIKIITAREDAAGLVKVTALNSTINKEALTFTKTVNISRLSLDKSIAYSADVN